MSFLKNFFRLSEEDKAEVDVFKEVKQKETEAYVQQIKEQTDRQIEQINAEHAKHNRQKVLEIKESTFIEVPSELEKAIGIIESIEKNGDSERLNSIRCENLIETQLLMFKSRLKYIVKRVNIFGDIDNEVDLKSFLQESYKKLLDVIEEKRKELGIEEEKAQ